MCVGVGSGPGVEVVLVGVGTKVDETTGLE